MTEELAFDSQQGKEISPCSANYRSDILRSSDTEEKMGVQ
jgi:hypothetical protein